MKVTVEDLAAAVVEVLTRMHTHGDVVLWRDTEGCLRCAAEERVRRMVGLEGEVEMWRERLRWEADGESYGDGGHFLTEVKGEWVDGQHG